MKKKTFLFLLFIGLMPVFAWGQVKIANLTPSVISVDGISVPRTKGNPTDVNVEVKSNVASFEVIYFEGQEQKGPLKMYREVERGGIVIKDFDPRTDLADKFKTTTSKTADLYPEPNINFNDDWWATVKVVPENKLEDYSIFVPADPFRGLALKPGQTSKKSVTLRTGEILFPVFLAVEDDASTRTGVTFSWALVNKIVTEGQEVFEFKPEDIMQANSGEIIKKTIVSKLPFDFIISEGASRGTVIPANYPQKLELYLGWNIIPIQYKDEKGLPTQAILILLVNDLRRPLLARSRAGVDQISVSRENIVVTNYSR